MAWTLHEGDCLEVLKTLPDGSVDAVVTDPPYGLEFMGKDWDHGVPGVPFWTASLRALRPGGCLLAFGGTRTYHRLACAVEDAGFEMRDCLLWLYGTGFPKGQGCLKPAYEPILLARKPGPKVLPLGIDACRVPTTDKLGGGGENLKPRAHTEGWERPWMHDEEATAAYSARVRANVQKAEALGRYPANVLHDGSDEVMEAFAAFGPTSTTGRRSERSRNAEVIDTAWGTANHKSVEYPGEPPGTAARFFYCAKASKSERGDGNTHPTVKPLALVRWLVRLICPPDGVVLDPFAGSGTTGVACASEGRDSVMIERHAPYCDIIRRRMAAEEAKTPLFPD